MVKGLEEFDSLAVLKYKLDGHVKWHNMDKFDEEDEPQRLKYMNEYAKLLAYKYGARYEHIWTKILPIFPTR